MSGAQVTWLPQRAGLGWVRQEQMTPLPGANGHEPAPPKCPWGGPCLPGPALPGNGGTRTAQQADRRRRRRLRHHPPEARYVARGLAMAGRQCGLWWKVPLEGGGLSSALRPWASELTSCACFPGKAQVIAGRLLYPGGARGWKAHPPQAAPAQASEAWGGAPIPSLPLHSCEEWMGLS